MENKELIERYIYAATKHMKKSEKEDIKKELNSIIEDMLEERCGEKEPELKDVRIALIELGTPAELAEKYSEDSHKCLIGAPYYTQYISMLKLVGACVIFGMVLAQILSGVMNETVWYLVLAQIFSGIIGGFTFAFTFITILFAIFYQKGIKRNTLFDSIDDLPPVPVKKEFIKKSEPIGGIILSIVFVLVFLICPEVMCAVIVETGKTIPVFNIEYLRQTWYLILAFAALGISREFVKIVDGKYTRRLMIATIITDLISGVLSYIWLINDKIANPEYQREIVNILGNSDTLVVKAAQDFNVIFFGVIVFALLLDLITTICRSTQKN